MSLLQPLTVEMWGKRVLNTLQRGVGGNYLPQVPIFDREFMQEEL